MTLGSRRSDSDISLRSLIGTNADRLALTISNYEDGQEFDEDTGNSFKIFGGTWYQKTKEGASYIYTAYKAAGENLDSNVQEVAVRNKSYEVVPASATAQVCGVVGAVADYLQAVNVTASTGTVTILDGVVVFMVIPAGFIGAWPINMESKTDAWKITTAAGTTCTCVGEFS